MTSKFKKLLLIDAALLFVVCILPESAWLLALILMSAVVIPLLGFAAFLFSLGVGR